MSVNLETTREQFYEKVYERVRELESVREYFGKKVHLNQHEHRKSAREQIITEDSRALYSKLSVNMEKWP